MLLLLTLVLFYSTLCTYLSGMQFLFIRLLGTRQMFSCLLPFILKSHASIAVENSKYTRKIKKNSISYLLVGVIIIFKFKFYFN